MSTNPPFPFRGPIHWILDWDGTITKHDTLDALVHIAASTKPNSSTLDHWDSVTHAYLDDYTESLEKLAPGGVLPTTIAEEKQLLKKLKDVEQRSLNRVSESGIFEGLTREQLDEGAKKAVESRQVELRNGYADFFRHIQTRASNRGDKVSVLSVNWSRRFIASSLRAAGAEISLESVMSNEIKGLVRGHPLVISSGDKLRWLERLRQASSTSGNSTPIIYVGDSWTDFECLLAADLGICIRDDPIGSSQRKLLAALQRLEIACPHIRDLGAAGEQRVVWATDFIEIKAWAEEAIHSNQTAPVVTRS